MNTDGLDNLSLSGEFLCEVRILLEEGAPITVGQSPWRNRRVSNIAGGDFDGPRLQGEVVSSGADWSELGLDSDGNALIALDVRSVWRTGDEAIIYVTYGGRFVIPASKMEIFADPARIDALDPSQYYFRTNPTFETSDERYAWLNSIIAVGLGKRTSTGVAYRVYQID